MPKRAISERVAQTCEEAKEDRCRCRCGGALHGARRGNVRDLPLDDPHSPAKKCRKCKGEGRGEWLMISGKPMAWECKHCGGTGRVLEEVTHA